MLATSDLLPIVGLSVFSIISVFFFTMDTDEDSGTKEKKKSSDPHAEELEKRREREERLKEERQERERREEKERERLLREERERERRREEIERDSRINSDISDIKYAVLILLQGPDNIIFFKSPSKRMYSGISVEVNNKRSLNDMAQSLITKIYKKTSGYIQIESPSLITSYTCIAGQYIGFFISLPSDSFDFYILDDSTLTLTKDDVFSLSTEMDYRRKPMSFKDIVTGTTYQLDRYTVQLIRAMGETRLNNVYQNPLRNIQRKINGRIRIGEFRRSNSVRFSSSS